VSAPQTGMVPDGYGGAETVPWQLSLPLMGGYWWGGPKGRSQRPDLSLPATGSSPPRLPSPSHSEFAYLGRRRFNAPCPNSPAEDIQNAMTAGISISATFTSVRLRAAWASRTMRSPNRSISRVALRFLSGHSRHDEGILRRMTNVPSSF
jgi:hypothetical protein